MDGDNEGHIVKEEDYAMGFWLPTENLTEPYDWEEVFGNDHPVEIDLGAGDGDFVLASAAREPERNFIGVERLLGRARKIAKRSKQRELNNCRCLRLESSYVMKYLVPEGSLERVHIMFPDPWPKKRHHKRRLIQVEFLKDIWKVLRPGGEIRFTTDHEEYFQWALEIWEELPEFQSRGGWDSSEDPRTDFEELWLSEGRSIYRNRWEAVKSE